MSNKDEVAWISFSLIHSNDVRLRPIFGDAYQLYIRPGTYHGLFQLQFILRASCVSEFRS